MNGAGADVDLLLVHGEEPFLIDRDVRSWLAAARVAAVTELDVEIIEGAGKLDQVRRALTEVPFLASARHLLLRDPPQLLERVRRGAEGSDALAAALEQRSPTTRVCIAVRQRVAPQNPVLALVRASGRVVEHPRLRRGRDQRDAVDAMLRERGLRLARGGVEHLLKVTGGDLGAIDSEIAKLAAFSGESRAVSLEDVRVLAAGSESVELWDVVDRLLAPPQGRGPAAVDALLADGVPALHLITQLARQFREILQAQELLSGPAGAGAARIAETLGLQPWQAERLVRRAQATRPALVERWLRELQWLDAETKAGRLDDVAGLRAILLRAARELRDGVAHPAPG